MPKYLILQQLQHIKELVISSLTGEELTALSIQEHLSLLLEHADVQELCENDQQRLLKLLKRLFPEWTIEPLPVPPPERVDIAYALRVLDVARSTFYRSIDKKLLKRSGKIGEKPVYLKADVDWLGVEAERMGKGGWVYRKLWKQRQGSNDA